MGKFRLDLSKLTPIAENNMVKGIDFRLGNVLKYILQYNRKGAPLEDLKKARHFLDMKIEQMESEQMEANYSC